MQGSARPRGAGAERRVAAWLLSGLVALATSHGALAAPRLKARPAVPVTRAIDGSCAIVEIENDGQDRRVILRSLRPPERGHPEGRGAAEMRLDLPAHARKRVFLPLRADARPQANVEIVENGEILAITRVQTQWLPSDTRLIGSLAPASRTLSASVRQDLRDASTLIEVGIEDLPPQARLWPRFHAFAIELPFGAILDPAVSQALRDHVIEGGLLVAGVNPEDPDAWQRSGLADFLPARPLRAAGGGATLGELQREAVMLGLEEAAAISRGLGRVVLVPRALDAVARESWPALLAARDPLPSGWQAQRRARARRWGATNVPTPSGAEEILVPRPPWWGAGVLLGAFFLAAVPLDGWLTRRSLKRGRRSRFGALRYPVLGVAATAIGLVIAEHASGGDRRVVRVDCVDLGPDGQATGRTALFLARGRAGEIRFESDDAVLTGVLTETAWDEQPVPSFLRVPADSSLLPCSLSLQGQPWQAMHVTAAWRVTDPDLAVHPDVDCDARHAPGWDVAWFAHCLGHEGWNRPLPLYADAATAPNAGEFVLSRLVVDAVADARGVGPAHPDPLAWDGAGGPDLVLARSARSGPDILIDGRSTDEGLSFTILRVRRARLPEPSVLTEPQP